eukprot:scaffold3959_cov128-Isochrysis_galbana.AAC.1
MREVESPIARTALICGYQLVANRHWYGNTGRRRGGVSCVDLCSGCCRGLHSAGCVLAALQEEIVYSRYRLSRV